MEQWLGFLMGLPPWLLVVLLFVTGTLAYWSFTWEPKWKWLEAMKPWK